MNVEDKCRATNVCKWSELIVGLAQQGVVVGFRGAVSWCGFVVCGVFYWWESDSGSYLLSSKGWFNLVLSLQNDEGEISKMAKPH